MATKSDGTIDVELTTEAQALILALGSHALRSALDAMQALRDQGYIVTRKHVDRVVAALRAREFCEAALVLATDPDVTDEQMIAAARVTGEQAVRDAGPYVRGGMLA